MSTAARSLSQTLRENETTAWLVLILAVAAVLRFYGLDLQSYWYDELFSAHISNPAHDYSTVVDLTLADVHPPFFQLMMWWSYQLFGYTEWAGRLPSAIAGVVAVAAIYFLGRELFDKRTGLYAAALAIANYYLLYYSQEARSYAFLYTLCILSFLFFVRALRSDSKANLGAYVVVTLLLLYTHYFGFLLLLAQGLGALVYMWQTGWQRRDTLIRAGLAAGVIVLCVLPLVPSITGHAAIDSFWITQPPPTFVLKYFIKYFASIWLALAMGLLVLTALGSLFVGQRSPWSRTVVLLLLLWIVVGYALPWLRGFISQPVLTDRNTIFLVPPFLLLAARGLSLLPTNWLQRSLLVLLLAYSAYVLVIKIDYYNGSWRNQFRQTAQEMGNFQPIVPVYTLNWNDTKYNVYFTQQQSGLVAVDMTELELLLADNDAPGLFWMADGHLGALDTDIEERFGLVEVGRIENYSTVATLIVNPANAVRLTVNREEQQTTTVVSSAQLPGSAFPMQLLVAPSAADRAEFSGEINIELLADDGRVISAYADAPGSLPIVLPLGMVANGTSLRVSLPAGAGTPEVWLIP